MTPLQDKVEKHKRLLKKGKKLYVQELAREIDELQSALAGLQTSFSAEAAQGVYRLAHKMKGSAPVFGLERVGKVGEQLVHLYEFTLGVEEAPGTAHLLENSFDKLLQLKIEYEIAVKEIELDEQGAPEVPLHNGMGGRLLLIDDDEMLCEYLVEKLELAGYVVDAANDVETGKRKLRERAYDVITLDLMMYPQSGYELFEFLKEDATLKWIPLIVLSGRDDVEDKVRCLRHGADDYVTKPFQYEELEARLFSLLKRSRQFEQMAFRDALTGVYNRRYFDHQLPVMLEWVRRDQLPISLAFLDIDRFKRINDTYGHQTGDLVLQGLAHMLQQHMRSTDLMARYGGEEFVVLFPGTTAEEAQQAMERILEYVRSHAVARQDGQEFLITFSAGVAQYEPDMSEEQWMHLADEAMYQAKQTGRNRVLMADRAAVQAEELDEPKTALKRLLVADGEEMIRELITSKLAALPVEIVTAGDAEEAFALLSGEPIDLCILDQGLTPLAGVELMERVRRESKLPDVKVLMLFARKDDDQMQGRLDAVDEYLSKPFSVMELEIRVKKLLGLV